MFLFKLFSLLLAEKYVGRKRTFGTFGEVTLILLIKLIEFIRGGFILLG
jgi:hypothetical protein